jgi:MFS family permease
MPFRHEALVDAAHARLSTVRPSGTRSTGWLTDVRRSYIDQAALGYLIYLLGSVNAFLAVALALTDTQAGLHSSAMAVGTVGASLVAHRLDDRYGVRAVHLVALGGVALAGLLIVWAPAFALTLFASALLGVGCGLLLGHVNASVSAVGGSRALIQFTRATLVSMLFAMSVPVVVGVGVSIGAGWQAVVVPAIALVGIAAVASRGRASLGAVEPVAHGRLPRAFWLPWLLIVLVVCVEFSVLFWAAFMVERSTGASLADATLTLTVFLAGVILARMVVAADAIGRSDPLWLLCISLVLCGIGTLLVWASTDYVLSAAAMLLGGVGLGVLYPVSASVTLAIAPSEPALASGRVVMASGVSLLLAPVVLGVTADLIGVVTAWLLIPGTCVAALLLTMVMARAR